jgi:hypothetical protein
MKPPRLQIGDPFGIAETDLSGGDFSPDLAKFA